MSATTGTPPGPDAPRHSGVTAIALMEAGKAAIALLVAAGLEISGPVPLRNAIQDLLSRFGADTEHGAFSGALSSITPDTVHLTALVLSLYGLMRAAEAWGLWRRHAWASWLGCISAALYLPLDGYAIARHPGWASLTLLAVNLLVVWILAQDLLRRRARPLLTGA